MVLRGWLLAETGGGGVSTSAVVYRSDEITEFDDLLGAKNKNGTTWVRAANATENEFEEISNVFDIHPLAIEDVRNEVRPKTEEFPAYTFILIKSAELSHGETTFEEEILEEPIGVFIGTDWVVTLVGGNDDPIDRVWNAVIRGDERLLQRGPDFTAYRIIDVVVDEYFTVLDGIGTQIELIEDEVLVSTDIDTLEAINAVRRDLLSFRKLAWPTREALSVLVRGDSDHVQVSTEKYFRDVYDNLVQVVDFIETYRDLVSGARDIYLNTLSQSTNEVMKILTVIATIFLPLTFIAGVYGMNFSGSPYNMPELTWRYGYPVAIIGMLVIGIAMVWVFRRRGYV